LWGVPFQNDRKGGYEKGRREGGRERGSKKNTQTTGQSSNRERVLKSEVAGQFLLGPPGRVEMVGREFKKKSQRKIKGGKLMKGGKCKGGVHLLKSLVYPFSQKERRGMEGRSAGEAGDSERGADSKEKD